MKTRQSWLVWIVVLLTLAVGCGKRQRLKASSAQQLGKASLSEGNPEQALAELSKSWELNDKDPVTAHYLGLAYWAKARLLQDTNMMVTAEEYMKKSLDMDDSQPDWRNNLCALYIDLGRYEEARRECQAALEDPAYRTPERALNNIGKSYIEQGKYAEALEHLNKALRVQPRSCQVLWNKGDAHKGLRQWDEALKAVERATEICPSYVGPYLLKAEILWYGKRDAEGARSAIKKVKALALDTPQGEKAVELERLIRQTQP